jgi:hypothetical protein
MRVLTIATNVAITGVGTTNGTAIDMTLQDPPFDPGSSAVVQLQLRAGAAATVNLQSSDSSASTTDWVTIAQAVLTSAVTKSFYFDRVTIGQRLRTQLVKATAAAGTLDVILWSN